MGYVPQHALENLKKYQYKGVDKSIVSRYVLNPFWTWFVTLWPLNVAPNTITLTGLSIVFFNFLTLIYYDPAYLVARDVTGPDGVLTADVGPPNWIYYTWGLSLFAYQTLDAIDGKQARRTGMAGPLGEMFDHGCDAINTTLEVILASRALGLGRSWWTVASQIATLANFYLTTWEEWHTGQLYLGSFSGPVEGILMIVAIFMISGYYGPQFWDQRIFTFLGIEHVPLVNKLPNLPLNESFMVFGALGLLFNIASSYNNVRAATKARKAAASKSGSTGTASTSGTSDAETHPHHLSSPSPLLLLLPFVVSASLQVAWLAHPRFHDSHILDSAAFVPFLCAWGLQFAHMVGRMIMAHVTREKFPVWDWVWVWSVVGVVDAHLPGVLGRSPLIQTTPARSALFVHATLLVSLLTYARFVTLVIGDITDFLGIACFTVRKKNARGEWVGVVPERAGEGKKAV